MSPRLFPVVLLALGLANKRLFVLALPAHFLSVLWTIRAIYLSKRRVGWRNYRKIGGNEALIRSYHTRIVGVLSLQFFYFSFLLYAFRAVVSGLYRSLLAVSVPMLLFAAILPDRHAEGKRRRNMALFFLLLAILGAAVPPERRINAGHLCASSSSLQQLPSPVSSQTECTLERACREFQTGRCAQSGQSL